jgi:hypothetical protein
MAGGGWVAGGSVGRRMVGRGSVGGGFVGSGRWLGRLSAQWHGCWFLYLNLPIFCLSRRYRGHGLGGISRRSDRDRSSLSGERSPLICHPTILHSVRGNAPPGVLLVPANHSNTFARVQGQHEIIPCPGSGIAARLPGQRKIGTGRNRNEDGRRWKGSSWAYRTWDCSICGYDDNFVQGRRAAS